MGHDHQSPLGLLLLWRSTAFPGSALDEFAFSRVEVGEILSVAVAGDICANDGKEPFGASDPLAFANASERLPHGARNAEMRAVGVASCRVGHGLSPSVGCCFRFPCALCVCAVLGYSVCAKFCV